MSPQRFAVIDCDGTIIASHPYLSHPDQVELLDGAAQGLRELRTAGLGLIVVTNQSGIARGLFDRPRLEQIHSRVRELLAGEGVWLDGIYVCPHLPTDGCGCRKPRPGLLHQAAARHGFRLTDAFVIGDNVCDIELGRAVGAVPLLVTTGYGADIARTGAAGPVQAVSGLCEAAAVIREHLLSAHRSLIPG
jgi:D-glycero-D-manno-heptose 1,7-bisphosphate phosphatase